MPPRRAFVFVWVTVLLDMIGIGLIVPVVPNLLRGLTHLDEAGASVYGGWLFFSYAAMQLLCAPLVGAASDALGRRPVLLLAVLGQGVDHALTAFAPSLGWLFVGRIIAGLFGASYATANAFIADVTPPEERGKAFGMLGAAFGVGFILGPALGGLLGGLGDRVPFLVAAGLSLANFFYGLVVLPETLPKEKRTPFHAKVANPVGAILTMPGGAVVRRLALSLFFFFLGGSVYPAIWAFYTSARYGWSTRMIGLSLAAYGLMYTLVQATLVGPVVKKLGERRASVVGLLVNVVALVATGVATSTWMVYLALFFGAPSGIAMPALQATMSKATPPEAQGRLQGVVSSLEGLSSIAGPILMTQLFGAFEKTTPGMPFFVGAALSVVALVMARSKKDETEPA